LSKNQLNASIRGHILRSEDSN